MIFPFLEIWMCGVQLPMLLALLEFGYILASVKYKNIVSDNKCNVMEKMRASHKKLDKICMAFCVVYFIVFNILYWSEM